MIIKSMVKIRNILLITIVQLIVLSAYVAADPSSLVINEVMRSNTVTVADEDGEYPDWIEIYNAGGVTIDLTGYSLSDDESEPSKWQFPNGSIAPGSFLLVFASDKDKVASGGFSEDIIEIGDAWSYKVWKSEVPEGWNTVSYDDSGWNVGASGFGYGDNDDATELGSATVSIHIREKFIVQNPEEVMGAILSVDYDDGFVAYLNGSEIVRRNLGAKGARVTFDSYATDHVEAKLYQGGHPLRFSIDDVSSLVIKGENVLAMQGHNSEDSQDMSLIPTLTLIHDRVVYHTNFKISADETLVLTDPNGKLIDRVVTLDTDADISQGRHPDGSTDTWSLFGEATPGAVNSNLSFEGTLPAPVFSHEGGKYESSVTLTLDVDNPDAIITYTTAGAEPTELSNRYVNPFLIRSTTVIKARAFHPTMLPGPVVTQSYLISESISLPIVSLSTDRDNFWNTTTGIYTEKTWNKDIERPVHIEFFEADGVLAFSADAGMSIHGASSGAYAQKSLALFARKQYGTSSFKYNIFPEKNIDSYEAFVLRNSGNDWKNTMIRDALGACLARDANIDYLAYRPVIVFINGQYWGLHNMREKANEHYIASNHDIDPDEVDIMEYVISYIRAHGSRERFDAMINYMESNDLTDNDVYSHVETLIDIDEFIEYNILEIYSDNGDWPGNNLKMWRPVEDGGKWRWILYDLDVGFGHPIFPSSADHNKLELATHPDKEGWGNYGPWSTFILRKLLKNETFRHRFITRFADLINTRYEPGRVNDLVETIQAEIRPEMNRHFKKWGGSINGWEYQVDLIQAFVTFRNQHLRQHIIDEFELDGEITTVVDVEPQTAGSIQFNTLDIESYPWRGTYFSGVPLTVTAKANPGYRFTGWNSASASVDRSIVINATGGADILASFVESGGDVPEIVINEINYNSDDNYNPEDWLELFNAGDITVNLSGWQLNDGDNITTFIMPEHIKLGPGEYLVLCRNTDLFSSIFPDVHYLPLNFPFGLSGGGEAIMLSEANGDLVDSVIYDDEEPWPVATDGSGATLALKSPDLDNTRPENWMASSGYGTPGAANSYDVGVDDAAPEAFSLKQNFPNPFNPTTTIPFTLSADSHVRLAVYSVLGQHVKTLVDERVSAGKHQFTFDADGLSSGIYIYRLEAGDYHETASMLLVK